ncbi:hypothetical protein SAMN04488516_101240 [Desulfonauticus submarinus]|uniref:Lipoprotein n=1 Tax=Desulfonauticus submarinus TaxID=206665 RepID=A0A1H0A0G5_9BACT|nr:hypothetical protein [Desulfonauticus submarinus]SDN27080.1 hypothetical protein SAMN04488516_101240 [Desulfonauticus submarinus]
MKIKKIIYFILIYTIFLFGCGKKIWPEPSVAEDKLQVKINKVEFQEQCYKIFFSIKGKKYNIKKILLQIETKNDFICTKCPFSLSKEIQIDYKMQNNLYYSKICLPNKISRMRLKVINIYTSIQPITSNIYIIKGD